MICFALCTFKLALSRDANEAAQILTKARVVFVLLTFVATLLGELTNHCFHNLGNIRSGQWGIINYFAVTIPGRGFVSQLLPYALTLRNAGSVTPSTSFAGSPRYSSTGRWGILHVSSPLFTLQHVLTTAHAFTPIDAHCSSS